MKLEYNVCDHSGISDLASPVEVLRGRPFAEMQVATGTTMEALA
jgi:hypothetical protein